MKAQRIFCVWGLLAVCAAMVFGAMAWLTRNALAAGRERMVAQHERALAEARADLEERTRLALWRMDAIGSAVVLRENRRAVAEYAIPGALAASKAPDPEVLLHFQIQQGGRLTSPELGAANGAENSATNDPLKERMKRLRSLLATNPLPGDDWTQLQCAAETGEVTWNALPKEAPIEQQQKKIQIATKGGDELRKDASYQLNSNASEYAQRAKAMAKSIENSYGEANQAPVQQQELPQGRQVLRPLQLEGMGEKTEAGQMRAVWLGSELFLMRQVTKRTPNVFAHGESDLELVSHFVQGVWLDARALKTQLLAEVPDLMQGADLLPMAGEAAAGNPLALVSFPFVLQRNEHIAAIAGPQRPPFGAALWVGWLGVILAVLVTSLLVHGVMRLSERRASFVSAVTHELRTPLTTFRLYSDMLESGAVKPEKRGDYLRVLSREADRLSHLVENVLAFSRIERGNARSNVRELPAGLLLDQSRERLEARLATAGLTLEIHSTCQSMVRADTAAVEHILFNLIDNAAKYAAGSELAVVHVSAKPVGGFVEITVRDHGPGIPPAEHGRIFRAFHKSAHEAAESKPGVGLGLALSRRLARAQGGDLACGAADKGACFVLRLPMV